jgi:hypothetical protein
MLDKHEKIEVAKIARAKARALIAATPTDVTASTVDAAGAVMHTDLDANSLWGATTVDTGTNFPISEQTVVGRLTGGAITGLTPLQQRELADVPKRIFPYPFTRQMRWTPYPATTTVSTVGLGFPALTTAGATVTARNPATTNMVTRSWRQGFVSAAGAGSIVTNRIALLGLVSTGSGTLGGFGMRVRFVPSDAATVAGSRMWMGVTSFVGAFINGEPSAITNNVGVGWGAADTNLQLFYGGSVAQTPINLGANFPARTLSADLYELHLYAPPTTANTVIYTVTRLNTGDVATGTLTGAATVIPQSTTILSPFNSYVTNNATALAVGMDLCEVLVEVDN